MFRTRVEIGATAPQAALAQLGRNQLGNAELDRYLRPIESGMTIRA